MNANHETVTIEVGPGRTVPAVVIRERQMDEKTVELLVRLPNGHLAYGYELRR